MAASPRHVSTSASRSWRIHHGVRCPPPLRMGGAHQHERQRSDPCVLRSLRLHKYTCSANVGKFPTSTCNALVVKVGRCKSRADGRGAFEHAWRRAGAHPSKIQRSSVAHQQGHCRLEAAAVKPPSWQGCEKGRTSVLCGQERGTRSARLLRSPSYVWDRPSNVQGPTQPR